MGGMLEIRWFLGARRDQLEMVGKCTRTFWEETSSDFGHGKGRFLAPDVILGRLDGLFASDLPGLARSPAACGIGAPSPAGGRSGLRRVRPARPPGSPV